MPAGIFETIFEIVDTTLVGYITTTSAEVINFMTPIFNSMVIIWIAVWGIQTVLGVSQAPIQEGLKRIITISAVIGLGLTLGTYSDVIVEFLAGWPEQVASALVGSSSQSTEHAIDSLYRKLFIVAKSAFDQGGVFDGNFGLYIISALVGVSGSIFSMVTAAIIIAAKIAIAALLGLGPLFISLIIFPQTKQFFERWLSQLINFGMMIVLATAVANITISIAETIIDRLAPTPDALQNLATLGDALFLFCVIGISTLMMKNVPTLAQSLGSGISLATQGAISGALSHLRPTHIRREYRRAQQDLRLASQAVQAPLRAASAGIAAYQRKFVPKNTIQQK